VHLLVRIRWNDTSSARIRPPEQLRNGVHMVSIRADNIEWRDRRLGHSEGDRAERARAVRAHRRVVVNFEEIIVVVPSSPSPSPFPTWHQSALARHEAMLKPQLTSICRLPQSVQSSPQLVVLRVLLSRIERELWPHGQRVCCLHGSASDQLWLPHPVPVTNCGFSGCFCHVLSAREQFECIAG